ncbi:MAG: CRISPR-associated endonuclease Cas2 [Candidatus Taylorbacteria bacterium CG11_big_fil_rev_8_21_14_0_20_46_11]|uniref:CRISPR-associated endoribonuclease Cas2 n=1 Tax=Candidatus Taylorbacteria bacterium CG11_big_fil_rev_8_21_14_0_20_46_11 TaxID=1975025 RepID=A0A2H0KEH5_9BACT|nr:MAG: CRISPR-associated endonuclease Cas2 [Candidatus Taylorbacteria bacterium CG11_big_fil_rev_8_21_14_0_20_46_11]
MIIASYDFSNDKVRTKFSKFLKKFGRKLQYSVYEIRNSDRVLQNIKKEVELKYKKKFSNADSVLVMELCERCKKNVCRYGYAVNDEKDVVVFE